MGKNYQKLMEQLYQQNKLLISALYEIHGDHVESTSLFCLEHDISLVERNKIMMILNKFSDQHTLSEGKFWEEKLYSEIPSLSKLQVCEFEKMLSLFWKNYVITDDD